MLDKMDGMEKLLSSLSDMSRSNDGEAAENAVYSGGMQNTRRRNSVRNADDIEIIMASVSDMLSDDDDDDNESITVPASKKFVTSARKLLDTESLSNVEDFDFSELYQKAMNKSVSGTSAFSGSSGNLSELFGSFSDFIEKDKEECQYVRAELERIRGLARAKEEKLINDRSGLPTLVVTNEDGSEGVRKSAGPNDSRSGRRKQRTASGRWGSRPRQDRVSRVADNDQSEDEEDLRSLSSAMSGTNLSVSSRCSSRRRSRTSSSSLTREQQQQRHAASHLVPAQSRWLNDTPMHPRHSDHYVSSSSFSESDGTSTDRSSTSLSRSVTDSRWDGNSSSSSLRVSDAFFIMPPKRRLHHDVCPSSPSTFNMDSSLSLRFESPNAVIDSSSKIVEDNTSPKKDPAPKVPVRHRSPSREVQNV